MILTTLKKKIRRFISKLINNTGEEEYKRIEGALEALKKEEGKPFQPVHSIPKQKIFKSQTNFEKRLWKENKKLPRKFKDEDE